MNAEELKLDYFKIYDVADQRVEYRVALRGQFDEEPVDAELLVLTGFANPVSKNREPIHNRNAHLTWYWFYQPKPEPTRTVVVENQFGGQKILVGQARALLAPAQKRQRDSQFPADLDHYRLYWVLEAERLDIEVPLEDQFGSEETIVIDPVAFGVPVEKEYRRSVSPVHNKEAHLVIYRTITRPQQQAKSVRDQFGLRYLTFRRSVGLAVPSVKLKWDEW